MKRMESLERGKLSLTRKRDEGKTGEGWALIKEVRMRLRPYMYL